MIMEYQELTNLLDSTPNHPSQVKKKFELNQMMTQMESITPIVKSNLKL